jgi:hypothetical protein
VPIGNSVNMFEASFDGAGKIISGVNISRPGSADYQGLFGYTDNAEIKDLSVEGVDITGHHRVGGLIGQASDGVITNSHVTGKVIGAQGKSSSGGEDVGGLIGRNEGADITDSYAAADVSGKYRFGGLVGYNSGAVISSYATGRVVGSGVRNVVGGLVGYNASSGKITSSHATGLVSAYDSVGGLVGANENGEITYSFATGDVTGHNFIGGLVGSLNDASALTNSYAVGVVTAVENGGGLVGYTSDSTIENTYATGSVTGSNNIGGLIGQTIEDSVKNSVALNSYISASAANANVGRIAGYSDISTFGNLYAWDGIGTGADFSDNACGQFDITVADDFTEGNGGGAGDGGAGGVSAGAGINGMSVTTEELLGDYWRGAGGEGDTAAGWFGRVRGDGGDDLVGGWDAWSALAAAPAAGASGTAGTAGAFTADGSSSGWVLVAGKLPVLAGVPNADQQNDVFPWYIMGDSASSPFAGTGTSATAENGAPYLITSA